MKQPVFEEVAREISRKDLTKAQRKFLTNELGRIETQVNKSREAKLRYLLERYHQRTWRREDGI